MWSFSEQTRNKIYLSQYITFWSIIFQPLEVIRTTIVMEKGQLNPQDGPQNSIKIQDQRNKLTKSDISRSFSALSSIYRENSIKGLYRGSMAAILKNVANILFTFGGIDYLKLKAKENNYSNANPLVNMLQGSLSKMVGVLVTNPLGVLKTNTELDQAEKSVIKSAQSIYRRLGLLGFVQGVGSTIMRDVPYTGIQFSLYNGAMTFLDPNQEGVIGKVTVFGIAGISSIFAVLTTQPFDVLRVKKQIQDSGPAESQVNTGAQGVNKIRPETYFQIGRGVYQERGFKGFYQGYTVRCIKKGLSGGVMWCGYQFIYTTEKKKLLK